MRKRERDLQRRRREAGEDFLVGGRDARVRFQQGLEVRDAQVRLDACKYRRESRLLNIHIGA